MSKSKYDKTLEYLKDKKKVLFITTSNRWEESKDIPKSSALAYSMQEKLGKDKITIINASKLKIYDCEGNVSESKGNVCGIKDAVLKDKSKNPTGNHRCWCSINNPSDELWKISKELFESDVVIFFGSIRWGKLNAVYAKLIERLTWLENRHTTLGESNIIKDIEVGVIAVGHNWNDKEATVLEKQVLEFFGFKTPNELTWAHQWTMNYNDESKSGYKRDLKDFQDEYEFVKLVEESIKKFDQFDEN
jgi:multimeric flavodoxin WrbA